MKLTMRETFDHYFPMLLADHSVDLLLTFPKQALINIARAYGWKGSEKGKDHSFFADYIHTTINSGKLSDGRWILLRLTREQYKANPDSKPDLNKLFNTEERQQLATVKHAELRAAIHAFKKESNERMSVLFHTTHGAEKYEKQIDMKNYTPSQ